MKSHDSRVPRLRRIYSDGAFIPTELNQLTGIAALLTFPLDVEVVEAEEREATEREKEES